MSSGNIEGDRSLDTNIAIWILIGTSAVFLFVRLWCRHYAAKLWWDDLLLTISWILLLVAGVLISWLIAVGPTTDRSTGAQKRFFFQLQNTLILLTTIATSWTKVAFAITLMRLARHKVQRWFLWLIMVTANLILITGITSTLIPACNDPRARFRPVHKVCWELKTLQSLGGATILYGGVIDILLALFPWLILRHTQLETREKIGLTMAMSLGALTGVIVILRTFYGLVQGDYNFDFMIFISIFNFLEPSVTIIAQAIPMFRVLFVNSTARRGASESSGSKPYAISAPISVSVSSSSSSSSSHQQQQQRSRDVLSAAAAAGKPRPMSMLEREIIYDIYTTDRERGLGEV
ncbi:hypothetical protein B0H66DRAFT_568975 [Apodospora peruviana]|uniref:Rhodopsin domain-containing protein n=1 Tax=Apodospora peruviana TaxID=516989 RepID=A0AAE0HTX4_9PEZI|nr:hypothetical protein B0H66DRAFT_568975 [Apodospora peruviana]